MKKGIRTFFVIVLCLAILFSLSVNAMALDISDRQSFTVTWYTVENNVYIGPYHPYPAHLVIKGSGCIITNSLFLSQNTKLTIEKGAVLQSNSIFMRQEGSETSALHIYGSFLSSNLSASKVRTLKVYDGCYLDITFDGEESKNEFMGALNRDNPGFEYTLDGLHLTAGECTHNWSDCSGVCVACKMPCPGHSMVNNENTNTGYCEHCGLVCTHNWSLGDGVCINCGAHCEHVWPADQYGGNCINCNISAVDACEHDYDSDYQCKVCHYINKDMVRAEKDRLEKRIGELDAILAIDTGSQGMTGTFVSSGNIAILSGIAGIAIGVIITALVVKKKSTKSE